VTAGTGPPTERTGPGQGPSTVEVTTTDTRTLVTLADDLVLCADAHAEGFELGWHAGYDAGVAAAEAEMAEAHAARVARVRALGRPDDYMARVAAAERYARVLADRQWLRREAWESAASQSVTQDAKRKGTVPIPADDLARALGARLPRRRRPLRRVT